MLNLKEKEIISKYLETKSLVKTAKFFNVCRTKTVRRILEENNIYFENYQNSLRFNENFFDFIDTEEKAYWLGFLLADGNVSSVGNHITCDLQLSDINHLEKLTIALNSRNNIRTDSFRCRFNVSSKHTKTTLSKYGMIPRKTYIDKKFPDLDESLKRHFIRGYFDGNGSHNAYKIKGSYNKSSIKLSLMGTESLLISIQEIIGIKSTISTANKSRGGDPRIKIFQYSGLKAMLFLDYLYKDSTIFLDRKYIKYQFCRSIWKQVE